jgi:hypothetical protein
MRRLALLLAAAVAAAAAYGLARLDSTAKVAAGYKAKIACSEIFVAGRDPERVLSGEFADISPALDRVRLRVDREKRRVRASLYGLGRSTAIYRDSYGCTLARGGRLAPLPALPGIVDFPLPASDGRDVDRRALEAALDAAFADEAAATRALLVLKDGAIVAERYAAGFSDDTPLLSWSMAKSMTADILGAAVLRGLIDLDSRAPVPEWDGDPDRSAITWNDLLRMQSGLAFSERYGDPNSDVSEMLFRARDAGLVAAQQPLIHRPGAFWSYSSGTTNLLQRTLRAELERQDVDYHRFARTALFAPIGAASFVLEPDSSGSFIGSSFAYATARDWAKLGWLHLNDGAARGARLLPEGWNAYVAAPSSASDRRYGGHFWLNSPGASGRDKYIPGVPDEAYFMAGHEGQYVLIIPDKNMVIVRAGLTRRTEPMPKIAPTFAAIYAAVRE